MADAELSPPNLEFVFEAHVTVDPPLDLGDVAKGGRRIIPITGGDFSGPQIARQRATGRRRLAGLAHRRRGAELEARYTLRTTTTAH